MAEIPVLFNVVVDDADLLPDVRADVAALRTDVTALQADTGPDLGPLVAAIEAAQASITALITRMDTTDAAVAALAPLAGRLSAAEAAATALTSRVSAVETVNTNQTARLNGVDALNTTQNGRLTALEAAVAALPAPVDLEPVLTRLTAVESVNDTQTANIAAGAAAISVNTAAISANTTAVGAATTAIAALTPRVTAVEGLNTTQNGRLTSLEGREAGQPTAVVSVTTSRDLLPSDIGKVLDVSGGVTVTLTQDVLTAMRGRLDVIEVYSISGVATVAAAAGLTLRSVLGTGTRTVPIYGRAGLFKVGTSVAAIQGELA